MDEETFNEALKMYTDLVPMKVMERSLSIRKENFLKERKQRNIETRNPHDHINHDVFDVLNKDSAYWAGFLLADGNIYNNQISLKLSARDKKHVEQFQMFIGAKRTEVTSKYARARIYNSHMASSLARLNIVPRKSLSATPPELPSGLAKYFWRGMLDGDGWISVTKNPAYRSGFKFMVGLVGSKDVIEAFIQYLRSIGIDTALKCIPQKAVYQTATGSMGSVRVILEELYNAKELNYALERKRIVAENALLMLSKQ